MADRTELFIRMAFRDCPRPRAAPDLTSNVLKWVEERKQRASVLERRGYLLAAVWASVALASVCVLGAIDWPAVRSLPGLSPMAIWSIPIGCAALLWGAAFVRKFVSLCARLAS